MVKNITLLKGEYEKALQELCFNINELLLKRDSLINNINDLTEQIKPIQEEVAQIEQEVNKILNDAQLDNINLDNYKVEIKKDISASPQDWNLIYGWIDNNKTILIKNKEIEGFNLIKKSINSIVFKQLIDGGVIPDGIEIKPFSKLKITTKRT